jgi:hypothetical protein
MHAAGHMVLEPHYLVDKFRFAFHIHNKTTLTVYNILICPSRGKKSNQELIKKKKTDYRERLKGFVNILHVRLQQLKALLHYIPDNEGECTGHEGG